MVTKTIFHSKKGLMKNKLLFSTIFIVLLSAFRTEKANAQVTGVTVSVTDSVYTYCTLPNPAQVLVSGTLTGTITATNDTVFLYVNFGDGSDTSLYLLTTTGTFVYWGTYFNHTYTLPGTYASYAVATVSGGLTGSGTAFPLTFSNTCAQLQGKLYIDANTNCTPDAGEAGVAYVPVWLVNAATPTDTVWATFTDDTGYYAIDLLPGTYTILANRASYYGWYWWGGYGGSGITPTTCPAGGIYTLTAVSSASYTENFAFACTTAMDTFDVKATLGANEFVRGDTTWVDVWTGDWWWYWDYTCASLSSTITLTLDPHLHYAGMNEGPAPTSVSGSVVTWDYTTGSDIFNFFAEVRVYCDSASTLGESLCNTVYATPTALIDPDLANNTDTHCGTVLSSWDPNELAVSPQGTGTPGYINNETALSYNIRFQNTGTAPANNITVNDTLSTNIDMNTLHVLKSSAPVEMYVAGNVVKFRFSDINLPDSAANPSGSIGNIVFGVLPKPGLAAGTPIPNSASIYFDYNQPVITNSVLNTINNALGVVHLSSVSMTATVYPNPADNIVYAKTDDKSDFTMTMMDMLGRSVAANKSISGSAVVNTQSLPTGIYIVTLTNSTGKVLTTKVTIEH